jgi:hypothetical protein
MVDRRCARGLALQRGQRWCAQTINSRSNSASVAKKLNISWPFAVVVSIEAP